MTRSLLPATDALAGLLRDVVDLIARNCEQIYISPTFKRFRSVMHINSLQRHESGIRGPYETKKKRAVSCMVAAETPQRLPRLAILRPSIHRTIRSKILIVEENALAELDLLFKCLLAILNMELLEQIPIPGCMCFVH